MSLWAVSKAYRLHPQRIGKVRKTSEDKLLSSYLTARAQGKPRNTTKQISSTKSFSASDFTHPGRVFLQPEASGLGNRGNLADFGTWIENVLCLLWYVFLLPIDS